MIKLTDQAYRLEKELRQIDAVLRKLDQTAITTDDIESLNRARDRWLNAKAKLAACVEKAGSGAARGAESPRVQDSR